MDIRFLFGWAEDEGITLPTKSDGSVNIPASFDLYNEWHKKQITAKRASLRDRGVDTDGMTDSKFSDGSGRFKQNAGTAGGDGFARAYY